MVLSSQMTRPPLASRYRYRRSRRRVRRWVFVLLLLGAVGVPVFSGGRAGLAVLVGPTGGYLFGWILSVVVIDAVKSKIQGFKGSVIAAFVGGVVVTYLIGVPWLAASTGMTLSAAVAAGALPFLPGDLFKVIIAALTAERMPKQLMR